MAGTQEYKNSLKYLFQWLLISIIAGISGSVIVAFLFYMLKTGRQFISGTDVAIPFWSLGGALISGLLFYKISPTASGDGIPSYIKGVLEREGKYSFRETIAKLGAALAALMTLNSGGILGPSGRVSAGLNSRIAQFLTTRGVWGDRRRIAAICGMAAAAGALFHSPIGGGILAVEVLQRSNMRYRDLFPSIMSSSIAVYIYNFLSIEPPIYIAMETSDFSNPLMPYILITAFGAAFLGKFYTHIFYKLSEKFSKNNGRKPVLKLLIGVSAASFLVYLFIPLSAGHYGGLIHALTSEAPLLLRDLFSGFSEPIAILIILGVVILASSLSIASGLSVGLTSPSVVTGFLVGAFFAGIFGYDYNHMEYYFFLVSGFSGLLSSTINVPIAAAVIAVEMFGSSFGFCSGVSSVIGFQVNRHHTLYDYHDKDSDRHHRLF